MDEHGRCEDRASGGGGGGGGGNGEAGSCESGSGGGGDSGGGGGDGDDTDEPENIIINEVDGLPNVHPDFRQSELGGNRRNILDDGNESDGRGRGGTAAAAAGDDDDDDDATSPDSFVNDEDLPTSVIVTNIDPRVFENERLKDEIEGLFRRFGRDATFQYFRSFKRIRVNFGSSSAAAHARIQMHQTRFGDASINCYFAQPVTPIDADDRHLQPPALTKQFLISPPASPPVGWQPREEGEPLVNHDLLAAIANLSPGCSHELHPAASGQPGIIVHVCESSNGAKATAASSRIPPTPCPDN